MSESEYRKMGKSGFGLIYQNVLYMSSSHLLLCKASTFHNIYHRFFFSDIQAVYLRRAFGYGLYLAVYGLVFFGFTWFAITSLDSFAAYIFGAIALLFLYLFIKTAMGGTFVKVVLETAAQSVEIKALRNQREALRFMDELKVEVERVQGQLRDLPEGIHSEPPSRRMIHQERPVSRVMSWHWLTYVLWLLIAGILAFSFFQSVPRGSLVFLVVSSLMAFLTGAIAVSLNIRERRRQTPLEYLTFATLGFLLIRAFFYYILLVVEGVETGAVTSHELMQSVMDGTLVTHSDFRTWFNIDAAISGFFALFGLLFCIIGERDDAARQGTQGVEAHE